MYDGTSELSTAARRESYGPLAERRQTLLHVRNDPFFGPSHSLPQGGLCFPDRPRDNVFRAVSFADVRQAGREGRIATIGCRGHVGPPQSVPQRREFVGPVIDVKLSVTRLDPGARVMRHECAQSFRRARFSQELSAVNGMETRPNQVRRVADIVQPSSRHEQPRIVHHLGREGCPASYPFDVGRPPRQAREVLPCEIGCPAHEVGRHTSTVCTMARMITLFRWPKRRPRGRGFRYAGHMGRDRRHSSARQVPPTDVSSLM